MSIGKYWLVALMLVCLTAIAAHAQAPSTVQMISAEELKTRVAGNQPITIIDVRSSEGYARSHTTVKAPFISNFEN
jgi:hypothetical protein